MTLKEATEINDEANRVNDDVLGYARDADTHWNFEYEIPTETNGWVYAGDGGVPATSHNWFDQFPNPTCAVNVHYTTTHPRDETRDKIEVIVVHDMEEKLDSREIVWSKEGEEYRTPLWVRRRLFWEAVEQAINWMEENTPESVGGEE